MVKLASFSARQFQTVSLALATTCLTGSAYAAAFQLFEQNASLLGQAYVASGAMAEDASTAFYNPAGLSLLPNPQIVVGGSYVDVEMEYKGNSTFNGVPPVIPGLPTVNGKAEGGTDAIIPFFYVSYPINEKWAVALGTWTPFGLKTDWSKSSFVRYSATRTSLKTVGISPALSYRFNDRLSFGGGVQANYAEVDFDSAFPAVVLGAPAGTPDVKITNAGDDWAFGWHVGAIVEATPCTRFGMTYHSAVKYAFKGTSKFASVIPGIDVIRSSKLTASTTLPPYVTWDVYHDFNEKFAGMASVEYTKWSVFDQVILKNVAFPSPTGTATSSFTQNYHSTWRYGLAGHYKPTDKWKLRAGVAYDSTPTNNVDRSIRLPDGDRIITSVGVHYQYNERLGLDLGYMHFFTDDGELNNETEVGKAENSADLFGFQLTWDFVSPKPEYVGKGA